MSITHNHGRINHIVNLLRGCLLIICLSLMGGCSWFTEPDPEPDWIAVVARVDNSGRIYLVDYNDPTHFKRVTHNDHRHTHSYFSPDRSQLVFSDRTAGLVHNPRLLLYDIESNTVDSLNSPNLPFPIAGHRIVFSPDGSGFYFYLSSSLVPLDVLYYDFSEQSVVNLTNTQTADEWVAGTIGSDTLIVFSNDPTAPGEQPWGFYFMNLEGEYLNRLENPHLEMINVSGITLKGIRNPEWNDDLKLFVFAQMDSTFSGFKIAITNLHGNRYETYTSGQYDDDNPVWGPGGQTILFHRRSATNHSGPYKVMVLDLQTGEVKEFVRPQVIDGATELAFPDY